MKSQLKGIFTKKAFTLFILAVAASAALTSCGSDDGGGAKRPSMVTIQGGNESYTLNMDYDSKGRLSTLTSNANGAHTSVYNYNDSGKVSSVSVTGSINTTMTFTYGADGKLTTFMRTGEEPVAVTWAGNVATIDGTSISFDEKGDIQIYDSASIVRDSGKGGFASVKGFDALTMLLTEQVSLYFASKRPMQSFSGSGTSVVFSNTYSGGMISSSTFALNGNTYVTNYTY